MKYVKMFLILLGVGSIAALSKQAEPTVYWLKIRAKNKIERTLIANSGLAIEGVKGEFVYAVGTYDEMKSWREKGKLESSFPLNTRRDFPGQDREYHNYQELTDKLHALQARYPNITRLVSAGKSVEGRDLWAIRISGQMDKADQLPGSLFVGGHHAREHLSVDVPLRIVEEILKRYEAGDQRIQNLVNTRDIHFIPAVNPDGLEWDISTGSYKYWRKNRTRNGNGSYGVDLNRNYGYGWGTGGSSSNPGSDVYMGPAPFSEPETRAVKDYTEAHKNFTVNLSFHTFSELILYPWGGKDDPIQNVEDRQVHIAMAKKMAEWNHYTAEQSSELYIASGDTTDWAYGAHRLIAFTFELDPSDQWSGGGFYPGAGIINSVVEKNFEPVLYLIEYSDNPYRVLRENSVKL